jgi:hypothetical protein
VPLTPRAALRCACRREEAYQAKVRSLAAEQEQEQERVAATRIQARQRGRRARRVADDE